ncbi:xyloglucan O-acetyltransferase 1-like [Lotus japonicus]|uniref:xyloglucan O-acetyltransferase 1-like n=1 Tax=Lotus japonicus TaxID=34305 RepID=UPI00258992B3|nr:xyloglucan O-acetyltransferase 1-like [Lotus japonicus]
MGSKNLFNDHKSISLTKRILPLTLYTLLPLTLVSIYLYLLYLTPFSATELLHSNTIITYHSSLSSSSSTPSASPPLPSSLPLPSPSTPSPSDPSLPSSAENDKASENSCDYFNGDWVHDMSGPLYNATTCGTIKESENCFTNGRPDSGYLYWRWKPSECNLPRFEPHTFLKLIENKHVAFVGDSLARNQIESLLCMLATASTPKLVYRIGKDNRRWHFPSHNANLSMYWSPFLVHGVERSDEGSYYNTMYLDQANERWARDVDQIDLIVVSFGHWFLIPGVFYEGGSVLGSLNCPDLNHIETDFYVPLRKALRTTLNSIIERKVSTATANGNKIDVIVKTFSPDHFEGDWDKAGTCSKTKPYMKEEKQLGGMEIEIRRIEMEEVENAKAKANELGGFRFEVMDITQLALLRPDGHPGPYMKYFPFANGVPEHVQNDCVHWCLPGPIDTWNEILLQMMKKWEEQPQRE